MEQLAPVMVAPLVSPVVGAGADVNCVALTMEATVVTALITVFTAKALVGAVLTVNWVPLGIVAMVVAGAKAPEPDITETVWPITSPAVLVTLMVVVTLAPLAI